MLAGRSNYRWKNPTITHGSDCPLIAAIKMWDLLIIEWLLEEVKMDVNARRGKYGMTPLMAALLTKDQEIIKIVLSNGANIG